MKTTQEQFEENRIRAMRLNRPTEYIHLLESLLVESEDVEITRGRLGLADCADRHGEPYQSMTCSAVISVVRQDRTNRSPLTP